LWDYSDALSDTYDAHPQDAGKLPICELGSDSYTNTHGKKIFVPIFEVTGWTERPANVFRIKPPPLDMLAIERKAEPVESAPSPAVKKKKPVGGGGGIFNDDVPFAPCR
jgi:hypothetical protein